MVIRMISITQMISLFSGELKGGMRKLVLISKSCILMDS